MEVAVSIPYRHVINVAKTVTKLKVYTVSIPYRHVINDKKAPSFLRSFEVSIPYRHVINRSDFWSVFAVLTLFQSPIGT